MTQLKVNFTALKREHKENENQIKRLQARQAKLESLFQLANELSGVETPIKSNALKGVVKAGSMPSRVLEILEDGKPKSARAIAEVFYDKRDFDTKERTRISNACGHLVRMGKLTQISHGVYQTNNPKIEKTTEKIGSDTKITQVPPKSQSTHAH